MSERTAMILDAFMNKNALNENEFILLILQEAGQHGADAIIRDLPVAAQRVIMDYLRRTGKTPGTWFIGGPRVRSESKHIDAQHEIRGHEELYKALIEDEKSQ